MSRKKELIKYVDNYFKNDPTGTRILDAINRKARLLQEKLERQDAPKGDKIVRETAEHILARHRIVSIIETGEMRFFKDGVYVLGAEHLIEEECEAMFDYDMSNFFVREIKGHIWRRTHTKLEEFDSNLYIVNFKNCLYNIKTDETMPHNPDYLSLNQKPVKYDPNKISPKIFGRFLSEVLYPGDIRTMIELLAYTFYRANPHEIFVNEIGYGNNGKTVMMAILTAMHGPKNISNIPLKTLIYDKFALADLDGKDVNIDEESSPGLIKDITKLKKITGNSPTWVQRKGKPGYEVVLHAKQWFTSNEMPDFADMSDGRYRREVIIPYPNKFVMNPKPWRPEEKREDPYLTKKLTTEEELTTIASLCMKVLRRILFQQDMHIHLNNGSIEERRKHREVLASPVQYFVDNVLDLQTSGPDDEVIKQELYVISLKFFGLNKIPPVSSVEFGRRLTQVVGKDRIRGDLKSSNKDSATGKRPSVWKGIKVKAEWLDTDKRNKQTSLLLQLQENEDREEG